MAGEREEDGYVIVGARATRRGEELLRKAIMTVSQLPPTQQGAVGCAVGWVTGHLAAKVGRTAALSVGGALLLLQVTSHYGYVTINWSQLKQSTEQLRRRAEGTSDAAVKAKEVFNIMYTFASRNVYLAGGFAGGFLIGIGF